MKCVDILNSLCGLCPYEYAEGWDNVGLLVGDYEKEVKSVYIAVDPTDAIIEDAIKKGADMIITHHPMLFSPIKRVVSTDFIGRRVLELAKNDIAYAAMHTNFDVMGMGYEAADRLDLSDSDVLDVTYDRDGIVEGIGRIGKLPYKMPLSELGVYVKRTFKLEHVRIFGDLDEEIECAAICPGSGKSTIDAAIKKGASVLITGDISHHDGIDANMKGLAIIDAGHYGIEKIFIQVINEYLSRNCPELMIYCEQIKEPFCYV